MTPDARQGDARRGNRPPETGPRPSPEELQELYRSMCQARMADERAQQLLRQGKIGFHVAARGEEAAQIASAAALAPSDWIVPSFRTGHIAQLRGAPLRAFFDNLFANGADAALGRQLPMHWSFPNQRIVSISGVVGTQLLHAVGVAMAMRQTAEARIAAAYLGPGTAASRDFRQALKLATFYAAPVVFFCIHNHDALTPWLSGIAESLEAEATAAGVRSVSVEGVDVPAHYTAMAVAAQRARAGAGPSFIKADVRAHDEDPLAAFREFLFAERLLDDAGESRLAGELTREVDAAVALAEVAAPAAPTTVSEQVFASSPTVSAVAGPQE